MPEIIYTVTDHLPTWAACKVINDDDSGLTPADLRTIARYLAHIQDNASKYHLTAYIQPAQDPTEYFSHSPAFGLPCTCIDVDVIYLANPQPQPQPQPALKPIPNSIYSPWKG